jgi:hypothetical protein
MSGESGLCIGKGRGKGRQCLGPVFPNRFVRFGLYSTYEVSFHGRCFQKCTSS